MLIGPRALACRRPRLRVRAAGVQPLWTLPPVTWEPHPPLLAFPSTPSPILHLWHLGLWVHPGFPGSWNPSSWSQATAIHGFSAEPARYTV